MATAIEMLALNPCRKMMVFGMDLGTESDNETDIVKTIDGDGSKRLSSEVDDDQDKGPVKKRRKQSKPVRIASSESLSDSENFPDNVVSSDKEKEENSKFNGEIKSTVIQNVSQENNIHSIMSSEEYDVKVTNGIKVDSEKMCNLDDNFRNDENSVLPINLSNAKHSASILDSFVGSQMSESNQNHSTVKQVTHECTTPPYQETGFEGMQFKKENEFVSSSSSPLSFPSVKPIHIPNSAPHTSSPLRIFNPEAFCDLCNKEFCNKYFLKTHKANKHGIYIDYTGPNVIDALPSMPFINYFSNVNEVLPSNSHLSRTTLRKPQLSISQQNASFLLKNSSSNGNTRAFCNICQREFCNKYFVRRHKAKIHGIVDVSFPDTPPSDTQEQKSQNASDVKLFNTSNDKCDDHEMNSPLSQSRGVASFTINTISDKENKDNFFITTGGKENSLNVEQQMQSARHDREFDSDESIGPGMSCIKTNASPHLTIFGNTQCHTDEISKDIEPPDDKMKKVGIMNSEAFCDICCKEYCNKYFLRTHKLKSHGIMTPDFDKRDDKLNSNENSLNYNSQVMPLNLIIGDQSSEKIDKIFPDMENEDVFCSLCGQKFKNEFLLKMHTSYMHPQETIEKNTVMKESDKIVQTSEEKRVKQNQTFKVDPNMMSENSQKSIIDEEKCFSFEFSNTNSMILKCEICCKSFDSASLETHIENEHGNLLEEIGGLGEEDNSDSQLSLQGLKFDCSSCQKQFPNSGQLEQHIIECHSSSSNGDRLQITKTMKENEEFLKSNQIQSMYSVAEIQTTPTSSFCEICKKELCNKYFMKTHMQRMHGISIENGAHIGGVVCDICNKELCSKYFLRVHKQNSHGIVDEVLGLEMSRNLSPSTDPSLRPSEQSDLNNRYFSHFTEVCTICSRRFRSVKWLRAHLLNDHGEEGKEKWRELQVTFEVKQSNLDKYQKEIQKKSESMNILTGNSFASTSPNNNNNCVQKSNNENYSQRFDSSPNHQVNGVAEHNVKNSVFTTIFNGKNTNSKEYHCSYCPFSTTILAFLFIHERSHIGSSNLLLEQNKKLQCKICSLTFDNYDSYEKHCLSHNIAGVSGFIPDCQNSNHGEGINKSSPSEYIKQKEILSNDHVMKEVSHLTESISPLLKESIKCSDSLEILQVNSSSRGIRESQQKTSESRQELCFSEFGSGNPANPEKLKKGPLHEEKLGQDFEVDEEVNGALMQVKESLELIANRTEIPVSFSVPHTHTQKQIIMQPFVLEDSGEFITPNNKKTGFKKSFLSSIVFLPVRERLKNPVMVSFKLTPT